MLEKHGKYLEHEKINSSLDILDILQEIPPDTTISLGMLDGETMDGGTYATLTSIAIFPDFLQLSGSTDILASAELPSRTTDPVAYKQMMKQFGDVGDKTLGPAKPKKPKSKIDFDGSAKELIQALKSLPLLVLEMPVRVAIFDTADPKGGVSEPASSINPFDLEEDETLQINGYGDFLLSYGLPGGYENPEQFGDLLDAWWTQRK